MGRRKIFTYGRDEMTLRTSFELTSVIKDFATSLNTTKSDVINYCLLSMLDPQKTLEDWECLPISLSMGVKSVKELKKNKKHKTITKLSQNCQKRTIS